MEPVSIEGRPPTLEELAAQQDIINSRREELNTEYAGKKFPDEVQAEFDLLGNQWDEVEATIENVKQRSASLARQAKDPSRQVAGNGNGNGIQRDVLHTNTGRNLPDNVFDLSAYRGFASSIEEMAELWGEGAKRVNEKAPYETAKQDEVRSFVERLLGRDPSADPRESFAHRILVTANPAYDRAFGKLVMGRQLTSQEDQIIRAAVSNTGLGSETPVPVTIDPTVIMTSDGATNPLRAISRTVTITGNKWQGISSDGVDISYAAELAELTSQTPSFDAPVAEVVKAQAEVQFSIEVDQDWGSFRTELARMFQDAKDMKEADKFLHGNGTNEPEGLIWALDDDGSSVVTTESGGTLALSDLDLVTNAIPPRFDTAARWLATKAFYSNIRALAGAEGRIDVWVPLAQGFVTQSGLTGYELLGYPVSVTSEMSTAFDTGREDVAVLGDFGRGFVIVDRVGLNVEVDPLVRNASGKLIGARAVYVYYRNTSKLLAANAFRLLQILHS